MANELLYKSNLDVCKKGILILISVHDKKFWISRDKHVALTQEELIEIISRQVKILKKIIKKHEKMF